MKILVTGSEGTLGKPLVNKLRECGHDVYCTDLFHTADPLFMRSDVAIYRQIERVIKIFRPEMVYHFAAEFGRVNGEEYFEQLWTSNVIGTRNMLELCSMYNIKLVFASSSEAYGELDVPVMEETMIGDRFLDHHNDYAVTKWVNEGQIRRFAKYNKLEAMTCRFFNSYGVEGYTPYRSVVCLFCYRILKGLPITIYKDYHRVFMYLDDFIDTMSRIPERFVAGEVLNIGGTEYRSIEELVSIIENISGKKANVTIIPREKANVTNKKPSIEKAFRLLGHNPKTVLEDGVKLTLDWIKETYSL